MLTDSPEMGQDPCAKEFSRKKPVMPGDHTLHPLPRNQPNQQEIEVMKSGCLGGSAGVWLPSGRENLKEQTLDTTLPCPSRINEELFSVSRYWAQSNC